MQARREVSDLVGSMMDAGGGLPLPEDRLNTIMEAAQVLLCSQAPVNSPLLDQLSPIIHQGQ